MRAFSILVAMVFAVLLAAVGDANAQLFPVRINEIRIDQPGGDSDEFFELTGPPGFGLTPFSYVVIGDDAAGTSGIVEAVISLAGQSMSPTGFFVAAEPSFALGIPDMVTGLNFENGDNVTHLLVEACYATVGQDLDLNDDCILDVFPWAVIVDQVSVVREPVPVTTECYYAPEVVGPDGAFAPGHVQRCPDDVGPFVVAGFAAGSDDTPGAPNLCGGAVWAFGARHTPRGNASVSPLDDRLVVSNIGASGDDGVEIEAGDVHGFFVQDEEGMDPAQLAPGAFLEETRWDPDSGQSQSIHYTNTGSSIEVVADFSGRGAPSRELMVLLDATIVIDIPGHSGVWDFRLPGLPPDTGFFIHSGATPDIADAEFPDAIPIETPLGTVLGNRICFVPENPTSPNPDLPRLSLTAALLPQLTIVDEGLVHFEGLNLRALGIARFDGQAASGSSGLGHLTLSNIGSSGDDGVSLEGPAGESGRFDLAVDPMGLPYGGDLRIETSDGVGATQLAVARLTGAPGLQVTPDFSGIGYSSYTLTALVGESVVYEQSGRTGPAFRYEPVDDTVRTSVSGYDHDILMGSGGSDVLDIIGGPTLGAERVRLRPDGVPPGGSLSWIVQRAWATGPGAFDVLSAAIVPPVAPVTITSCEITDPCTCEAEVTWTNGGTYDQIRIFVNGVLADVLPGDATSDAGTLPGFGAYIICVVPFVDGTASESSCCQLVCNPIDPVPPSDFVCTWEDCTVQLSWANLWPYDFFDVVVDGVVFATLPGVASTTILTLPSGGHLVCLEPTMCGVPTATLCCTVLLDCDVEFVRGDCNADGGLNLADAIFDLDVLFMAMPAPCDDACDTNDDGGNNLADVVFALSRLFTMGPDPQPPFPACGSDPTVDAHGCDAFPACP